MADTPDFDTEQAHRYFSTHCFNMAWQLIEKPDRTPEDDEQMIRLAQASLWHWTGPCQLYTSHNDGCPGLVPGSFPFLATTRSAECAPYSNSPHSPPKAASEANWE